MVVIGIVVFMVVMISEVMGEKVMLTKTDHKDYGDDTYGNDSGVGAIVVFQ